MSPGWRDLLDTITIPKLHETLIAEQKTGMAAPLIWANAVAFHIQARPRTDQVRFLVPRYDEPSLAPPGWRYAGLHRLRHEGTGTRVWYMVPRMFRLSTGSASLIFSTTVRSNGFEIVSPSGLVRLLLCDPSAQASADIVALLRRCEVDLSPFDDLLDKDRIRFERLQVAACDPRFTAALGDGDYERMKRS